MKIKPFSTEQFFALYEFTAAHMLSSSDCETMSVGELLQKSGRSASDLGQLQLGYTESQGNPAYRKLVCQLYQDVTPEDVVILTSPVEGIYLTMQTLLNPADHVIALGPAYDALHNVAEHLCGQLDLWQLQPTSTSWQLDFDSLNSMISPRTRLIIVNFPHNPTGFQPTPEEFHLLLQIAEENDCWVFCDEIYRGLETGLQEQLSIPSAADCFEKAIVLNGLSKTYGLPGLRAGWLVVRDSALRKQLIGWKHYTTICPSAPTEFLAMQALQVHKQLAIDSSQLVAANLREFDAFVQQYPGHIRWRAPQAGSTALAEIRLDAFNGALPEPVDTVSDYCHLLAKQYGILLLPGVCLGGPANSVRIGLGRRGFSTALQAWRATGHFLSH